MVLLLKYGELYLKGLNRPHFEALARRAVKRALRGFEGLRIENGRGTFVVYGVAEEQKEQALTALSKVFGLHSVTAATEMEKDMQVMGDTLVQLTQEYMQRKGLKSATFKVEAKRADKRFPVGSQRMAAELGGVILERVEGLSVDVHHPDFRVFVEVRETCYGFIEVLPGAGGMPPKSSGRGMLLLSGGIDSPVAGYLLAKRGVELNAVHYHSFPYTSEAAKQKVIDLAQLMSEYTGRIYLYVVSFTEIQMQIYEKCPQDMLVIIMRRFMMRIAQKLAEQTNCLAIGTGESIGQVASQTMESMFVTDNAATMPVFRPLIGMDKMEIIQIAQKIGTYETSIQPFEDCCTVFVPKHPQTRPKLDKIVEAEQVLDIDALVQQAVESVEVLAIG